MTNLFRRLFPSSLKNFLKDKLNIWPVTVSQAGQDYWVYGEVFNEKKNGYFVDIGAFQGISISNTYLLEKNYNWTGLCIEANPGVFEELKKNRSVTCLNLCLDRTRGEVDFLQKHVLSGINDETMDNDNVEDADGEVITLETVPLLEVLRENNAPKIIDYLSIDVEGAEERILDEFDFTEYKFRSVTIERPSEKLRKLFRKNEYVLIKEIPELDCFYVHNDFLSDYNHNLYQFYQKKYLKLPKPI